MRTSSTAAMIERSAIHITREDLNELQALVERYLLGPDASAAEQLEAELDRAVVLPRDRMPPGVVTMGACVLFEDEAGRRRKVQLVYPSQAAPSLGRVSVLAPIGAALLGLSVGQTIDWPMPGGRTAALTIIEVERQPRGLAQEDLRRPSVNPGGVAPPRESAE